VAGQVLLVVGGEFAGVVLLAATESLAMSATTLPLAPRRRWREERTLGALLLRRFRVERRADGEASSVMASRSAELRLVVA
jgi:hypothetical protein